MTSPEAVTGEETRNKLKGWSNSRTRDPIREAEAIVGGGGGGTHP